VPTVRKSIIAARICTWHFCMDATAFRKRACAWISLYVDISVALLGKPPAGTVLSERVCELSWRGAWIIPINDLLPSGSFHA
jgi:hypothetical protein